MRTWNSRSAPSKAATGGCVSAFLCVCVGGRLRGLGPRGLAPRSRSILKRLEPVAWVGVFETVSSAELAGGLGGQGGSSTG